MNKLGFLKNSIFSVIIQMFSIAIVIVNRFVYADLLSAEMYGVYNILTLIPTLCMLMVNFGIGHSISYFLSKKLIDIKKLIYVANIFSIILGTIIAVISYYIFGLIYPELDSYLLLISVITIPLLLWIYFISFIFLGKQETTEYFIINNMQIFMSLIFFAVLSRYINNNLLNLSIYGWLVGAVITVVYTLIRLHTKKLFQFEIISLEEIKSMIRYGIKMYLSSVMNFLNYRLDNFIISAILSYESLGMYAISVAIADMLGKISQTISLILFSKLPMLSEKKALVVTSIVLKITLILNFISIVLFLTIGYNLLNIIFDSKYNDSFEIFLYLAPGVLFLSIFRILYHDLAAKDLAKIGVNATAVGLVGTVILDFLFIPFMGIKGAALASTVTYLLSCLMIMRSYKKVNNVSYKEMFLPSTQELIFIKALRKKNMISTFRKI